MILTDYTINHPISASLIEWAISQPDYVTMEQSDGHVTLTFDHANEAAETAFKELLARTIGLSTENVNSSDSDLARTTTVGLQNFTDNVQFNNDVQFDDVVEFVSNAGFDDGISMYSPGNLELFGSNIIPDTTTGSKIGTGTTQKLGFWNATPIVQPAANADTSGATLAELETEVNELKAILRSLGLMAT